MTEPRSIDRSRLASLRYIAIEGPVGVGKTTLARMLAKKLGAGTMLEPVEGNPFLHSFYDNPRRHAFQTQLYFLLSRYRQHLDLAQADLFRRTVVSDYVFEKDRIFAYANLSREELYLYEKVYELLRPRAVYPDLLVLLQARTDVLMRRIRKRAADYERAIRPEYVEELNRSYTEHFYDWSGCPILTVNCSDIDFVANEAHLDDLIHAIGSMRSGREHYVPLGSG